MDTSGKKTHWKALADPRFIGAYALPNGEDITVTIERVQLETVTMLNDKKEDHTVAYLKDQKPMILNVTNSKSIHKLYGPYIEDWKDKQITLFVSMVKFDDELVECLRIRPTVIINKEPQPIHPARFQAALTQIRAGTYTAEKLRHSFKLTKAQERKLKSVKGKTS